MGVMLRPGESPEPSEEEIARLAGLVPGDVDMKHFEEFGLVDAARHEPGLARKLFLGREAILGGTEGHSHSSAPFFHA